MSATSNPHHTPAQEAIRFANGVEALAVVPEPNTAPERIIAALNLFQPKSVLLVVGGARGMDDSQMRRLAPLFSRVVARAAGESQMLVIDGGTSSGVMQLLGEAVADRGRLTPLLGVAPKAKSIYPGGLAKDQVIDGSPLEPNHSHFVLTPGKEWGDETSWLIAIVAAYARKAPVQVLLVNGGSIAKNEVLQSVRRGWPILILEGSGRLADEIASLADEVPERISDQALSEILSDGNIRLFSIDGSPDDFEQLLLSRPGSPALLEEAWKRYQIYDHNSDRFKLGFYRMQAAVLSVGVLAVLLAVGQQQVEVARLRIGPDAPAWMALVVSGMRYPLIALPVLGAILLALSNRFRPGNRWILCRSSAEAVRREIYRYRVQACAGGIHRIGQETPEELFQRRLETIGNRLMQSELNRTALAMPASLAPPTKVEGDDGFCPINAELYLKVRVENQLGNFRRRAAQLSFRLQIVQTLIVVIGGLGTLLAAFNREIWIALTTTLATALATYLHYSQTERSLIRFNQIAEELANLRTWWDQLPPIARRLPRNIHRVVDATERLLESELAGWAQRMEDTLTDLRAQQKSDRPRAHAPAANQTEIFTKSRVKSDDGR